MTVLGLTVLTAVAIAADAPWWLVMTLAVPGVLFAPGLGWARWLLRRQARGERDPTRAPVTGLQLGIDAAWIAMAWAWIAVALVRELGVRAAGLDLEQGAWALLVLTATFGVVGSLLGRHGHAAPSPRRELLGGAAVLLAVLAVAGWRQVDLARPLDGYWWLSGADAEGHAALPLTAGAGWSRVEPLGWPEAGALRVELGEGATAGTLRASQAAEGRLILAIRGPLGSSVEVDGQRAVVTADAWEEGEEAPLRRYLEAGTAGLAVPVDLAAGEELAVRAQGQALYVLPGTEALWSAHAVGALRYTHYWQLLNQVENLDWARESLKWRRLTVNQPPAWSPLLAVNVLFGDGDLPGANILFLWVLALVGGSAVRLGSLVGRGAPVVAWLLPAGGVGVHGLLMIEPASTVFPDSLYTAAILAVAAALAGRRPGWFAALGIAAGLLRYAGFGFVPLLALAAWLGGRERPGRGLGALLLGLGACALAAAALSATGQVDDLLFVLYFETFPEHWHGDFSLPSLLPRIPDFYWLWLRYSGGGVLLALAGLPGAPTLARRGARFLLLGAFAYSLILCTVDHHPTHYFLPLVALTGPALIATSAALPWRWLAWALVLLTLGGLWTTVAIGQVF